jgi:hypothetical protein
VINGKKPQSLTFPARPFYMTSTYLPPIQDLVRKYKNKYVHLEERRNDWHTRLKPLLKKTLSELTEVCDAPWYVTSSEETKNYEAVILYFGIRPSGIQKTQRPDDLLSVNNYMERGASLWFCLRTDAKIIVTVEDSYIEEIEIPPEKAIILDGIDPQTITEDTICDCVKQFLARQTASDQETKRKIGFITDYPLNRPIEDVGPVEQN